MKVKERLKTALIVVIALLLAAGALYMRDRMEAAETPDEKIYLTAYYIGPNAKAADLPPNGPYFIDQGYFAADDDGDVVFHAEGLEPRLFAQTSLGIALRVRDEPEALDLAAKYEEVIKTWRAQGNTLNTIFLIQDIDAEKLPDMTDLIERMKIGLPPREYSTGAMGFKNWLKADDLDLIALRAETTFPVYTLEDENGDLPDDLEPYKKKLESLQDLFFIGMHRHPESQAVVDEFKDLYGFSGVVYTID